MVDYTTYIQDRLDPQQVWHSDKARWNKNSYYITEIITMGFSAMIPVINLLPVQTKPVLSALLAGSVVVAAGIAKLGKFQENWLNYRALAEALEREKELCQHQIGDYAVAPEAREKLLIERVENMLASTTSQFLSIHRAEQTPPTPPRSIQ